MDGGFDHHGRVDRQEHIGVRHHRGLLRHILPGVVAQFSAQGDRLHHMHVREAARQRLDALTLPGEQVIVHEVVRMQPDQELAGFTQCLLGDQARQRFDILVVGREAYEGASVAQQPPPAIEAMLGEVLLAGHQPRPAQVPIVGWDPADVDLLRSPIGTQSQLIGLQLRPASDEVHRRTGQTVAAWVVPPNHRRRRRDAEGG